MTWRLSGVLLTAFSIVFSACATTEPPANVFKVDAGVPPMGAKWVVRTMDHQSGGTTERTWTVVEASYPGRSVYGVTDGTDTNVYDRTSRNLIAVFRSGRERFASSPDDGTFSWPLWVGKSWLASYTYYDRERGRSFSPVQSSWTVAGYEDVTVPAGTFKAFRIESSPGTNNSTRSIFWYAPDVRLVVKTVFERTSEHYLGHGRFTTELVKYLAQ